VDDREGDDPMTVHPPTHTVLYLEDTEANTRLVQRIFQRRPEVELITTTHGLIGIDMARDRQPAVVLLDVDLPDIDGAVVLKCLRANPLTAAIPVVIVSADAVDWHIQHFLESGAVAYLTKPLDISNLLTTVDDLIREQAPPLPRRRWRRRPDRRGE
jgi:CheY-like chemotaxis protein